MKKERLIPKEKRKRVIYLDKRGGGVQRKTVPAVLFSILCALCLVYFIYMAFFVSYGSYFFFIWGFLAIAFALLAWLMWKPDHLERMPLWFRRLFVVLCLAGLIVFAAVEGMIIGQFFSKASQGADYCVILGAEWKVNGPSLVLRKRLDTALEYLFANENTRVVVSGGQGSNEVISEAEGMKQYLMAAGIAEERIIVEDLSSNTYENLLYSQRLIDAANSRVVLVTNNFHVFRACMMAKKMGYVQPEGLAAGSYLATLPNNMMREFFGVMKDALLGRIW